MTVMADKRSAPRVAFGLLVESGMVPPGTMLTDAKRRWTAQVRADGSIDCDGTCGLDPQGRRRAAGRAVVQRLDLLACRGRRASSSRSTRLRQQHLSAL